MNEPSAAQSARRLVRSVSGGVLSTLSQDLEGYPFGSVTPVAMTQTGELTLYVSAIAQHTRNMLGDPRVSLTTTEEGAGNQQALGRATVVGDATPVPPARADEVAARYFMLFPEAREYAGAHDFSFFWITPRRVRYIAGFGRIHWIETEDWLLPTPGWAGDEQGIVSHMNEDHGDALVRIASAHGAPTPQEARLVTVDQEGAHVRSGGRLTYVPFGAPAHDQNAMRAAMVALARAAT